MVLASPDLLGLTARAGAALVVFSAADAPFLFGLLTDVWARTAGSAAPGVIAIAGGVTRLPPSGEAALVVATPALVGSRRLVGAAVGFLGAKVSALGVGVFPLVDYRLLERV